MVKLSLNVNKIATLRNARGGNFPNLIFVVEHLLKLGAQGITVHPRPDGRHILYKDVSQISQLIRKYNNDAFSKIVEFNIEGYPSLTFLKLMDQCRPHQCTLVPDSPSALTSDQGWNLKENFNFLKNIVHALKKNNIRSSIFIDPLHFSKEDLDCLSSLKPDRVEFYTGAWSEHYEKNLFDVLDIYKKQAEQIHDMDVGINAGHDLNQKNLKLFLENVPHIQEVSIGHAFICESLYDGMEKTFENYMNILKKLSAS